MHEPSEAATPEQQPLAGGQMCVCATPSLGAATPSLVFPFCLEADEAPAAAQRDPQRHAPVSQLRALIEATVAPQGALFQTRLLRDVRFFQRAILREEGDIDAAILAIRLSGVGYRVYLRSALGGGPGTDCFHNLRNEFLVVQGEGGSPDLIVEPDFRGQFAIPATTPRYTEVLGLVPVELVAPAALLAPLVRALCAEMSAAFEAHGLSLPPWRQSKSLLSKWLPSKSRDHDVSPSGSPRMSLSDYGGALPRVLTAGGASPATRASSCALTPLHSGALLPDDDGASPRGVLASAGVLLMAQVATTVAAPPGAKPRSLLSTHLAGCAGRQVPGQLPSSRVASVKATYGVTFQASGEWQQPPIRSVRMLGK